jgi:hypothetical protein
VRSELLSTLIAQIVRFARPNIQIYDAHVIDLYEWVCAQYLVGVKCRNKGKAQLSSALDRISETDHAGAAGRCLLLTRWDLQVTGARAFPEPQKKQRVGGGHDRDRTCDPYHVKVVLSR